QVHQCGLQRHDDGSEGQEQHDEDGHTHEQCRPGELLEHRLELIDQVSTGSTDQDLGAVRDLHGPDIGHQLPCLGTLPVQFVVQSQLMEVPVRTDDLGLLNPRDFGETVDVVREFVVAHISDDHHVDGGGDRKSTRLNSSHVSISY